jgi:hypothetical protein
LTFYKVYLTETFRKGMEQKHCNIDAKENSLINTVKELEKDKPFGELFNEDYDKELDQKIESLNKEL